MAFHRDQDGRARQSPPSFEDFPVTVVRVAARVGRNQGQSDALKDPVDVRDEVPGGRSTLSAVEFNDVIRRRKMVRAFTGEPLAPGTAERLLRAANRAPSAGFSQGYSFLVLEGDQQAPLWQLLYEQTESEGTTQDDGPDQVAALSTAPLVIVPLASKDVYLDRYARPGKGWTDRDEARWPIPYWYVDTGFAALLILLAAVDEELGAVFFGPPDITDFRARFGVPAEWTPIGVIAIGHPDPDPAADPVPPARASDRKSLDELVHRGRW
jgi:nitroreductase